MARSRELAQIDSASFDQLKADFPAEWGAVGEQLVETARKGPAALEQLVRAARSGSKGWRDKLAASHGNPQVLAGALPAVVAERLTVLAVEQMLQAAATGQQHGTVKLGLWSGLIIQRLLFARALERKPASLTAFKLCWPLVIDRRKLMPLVQPRGIYCFYSKELVRELAARIAARPCLEIAAGDGTLSRFLAAAGVTIRATDDFSWAHAVTYPEQVERLDAARALARHAPKAVICSFPPPGNDFERAVLASPGVERYFMIGTRHRFAAGNWTAYEQAKGWKWKIDDALSALVLPPELDPAVVVFERS
jgi:hypothetical protein